MKKLLFLLCSMSLMNGSFAADHYKHMYAKRECFCYRKSIHTQIYHCKCNQLVKES